MAEKKESTKKTAKVTKTTKTAKAKTTKDQVKTNDEGELQVDGQTLDQAVKVVVKEAKKEKEITETNFIEQLVKPFYLEDQAIDQLVQEFEDNGISIVDEKGEPSH